MDNKISNIIGVPIPQWLIEQFNVRSEKGAGYGERNTMELQFLSNKSAWVRLVSSIDIKGDDLAYFAKRSGNANIKDKSSLSENFILYAGVSKYQRGQDGTSYSTDLRSGISQGSYGMLGSDEISAYGYTPMPGITKVSIETMGRMGSVRSATVSFKVFNRAQLDIIDALYFKLGYTMLLEWGHTYYYRTPANATSYDSLLMSTEDLMIDPFSEGLSKEKINYKISLNVKKSYGNYDGMLGIVTNFNFTRNNEGYYDCSVKMIGLGAIAESLKINRSNVFPKILTQEIQEIVRVENAIIQAKIDQQIAEEQAKISALQKSAQDIQKEQAGKKTLNEIYEEKIAALKYSKLSNYLYLPSEAGTDLYNPNSADIVYDPEQSWAIRKFGVILNSSVAIKSVVLDVDWMKRIDVLSTEEKFLALDEFSQNKYSDYSLYSFVLPKKNDGNVFIKNGLTADQITALQLTRISYKAKSDFGFYIFVPDVPQTVSAQTVSGGSLGVQLVLKGLFSIGGSNDAIRKVTKKLAYRGLFADPTFTIGKDNANITISLQQVTLSPGINEDEVLDAYHTNKLNTAETVRYYPVLTLEKEVSIDNIKIPIIITISDSRFIKELIVDKPENQLSKEFFQKNKDILSQIEANQKAAAASQANIAAVIAATPKLEVAKVQEEEASKFQSSLEVALRTIQLYTYNRARNTTSVVKQDLTANNNLIEAIFKSVGLYSTISSFETKIINGTIPDIPNYGNLEAIAATPDDQLLEFYVKYGFNVSIMANVHNTLLDSDPLKDVKAVNHKDLLASYVIPYRVSQQFSQGIIMQRPVYIQFGTILMLINHLALMYDSKEDSANDATKQKRPIFYVDYNPNSNYCLSSLNHLSTNPFNFMIPYSGKKEDFEKLFDKSVLQKALTGGKLFNPESDNVYSKSLPQFITGKDKDVYRGKIMSVLIDIDYLLDTIKKYSDADNNNSIYFKPFMDKILSDMSKALGNFNLLRLAYNDAANCFYIVDDQIVPPLPEEKSAEPKTSSSEYEIPLYGNTSIAKSLEIKTDISSRLSNMIAISANSEGKQGEMGTDATPFGHINKNFTDRYIPLRTDIVDEKQKTTKNTDGDSDAAIKFNDAIKQYYGYIDVSLDSVNGATNYYIARMAKTKSENPATRASAIIPVSLNFTTDGISGFNMYQSFGINEELLPYTYTAKNKLDDVPVDRRVGFCVVGLTHNIENNQWNTSVRANMIFLKSSEDYKGEKLEKYPSNTQGKIRNPEIFSGRSPTLGGGNTLNVTSIKGGNKARLSAIINMPGSWIDKTVAFLKWREGFISAPANDEGTLRLGYGSDKIYRNGKLFDVTSDSRTTESEALQTLLYEIQYTSYYTAMTSDLGKSNWDKLNDNQKAALMSMSYNCGAYFVRKNYGRAIKDAITNSDYERAAQIIANGSPNRGKITGVSLNERRALEAALFLSRP